MARGVKRKDYYYEIEETDQQTGVVSIAAKMLVYMDQYNIGTADDKVQISADTTAPNIKAHIKLNKNENEYGIHPRYALCEYAGTTADSACNGVTPKRFVELPILTIAQFEVLNVYDEVVGGTQTRTTMKINHSFNGSAFLTYKIRKLVNEVKV
jgi:hypothetical protein